MQATRALLLPLLLLLLCATLLVPPGARTQEGGRGLAVGAQQGGKAAPFYALVIGNNVYQKVSHLQTAESDARAVEETLRESYGFRTKLLLNATRQQIIAALNSYRRELDADSNLLIYYAGHGVNDKEIDRAYWLPVDAEPDDNSNWISADDITSNIRGVPARHVLIISDSCYSGTLTGGLGISATGSSEREQFLRRVAAGRSRTLMATGGDAPVADDGDSHSVFAAALLRGLREIGDARFTAFELFAAYVVEPVASRTAQTPVYKPLPNSGHEGGDFVFTRIKPAGATADSSSCSDVDAKEELYKTFLDNYRGNVEQQKVAYEAGKEYIHKYEGCPKESDKNIVSYLRKWVTKYEAAVRQWERWKSQQP
jgi:uncharacterized caspase-like protein